MPYIIKERRESLLPPAQVESTGELNYMMTMLAIKYIKDHGLSYQSINDVLGAFDGASKEFYKRVAEPYELKKRKKNGDVYPRNIAPKAP